MTSALGTGPLGAAYMSSLSCWSMDPAAAVVHPLPRKASGGYSRTCGATLPSPSCRSWMRGREKKSTHAIDLAVHVRIPTAGGYLRRPHHCWTSCIASGRAESRRVSPCDAVTAGKKLHHIFYLSPEHSTYIFKFKYIENLF
jgi:hypothetical protein